MSFPNLLTWPCTLIRRTPGAPDVYNDAQLVETQTPAMCYWEMRRTTEQTDVGAVEVSHVTVFLLPDVDLAGVDAVQVTGGPLVEAFGPPELKVNARTGKAHHVELVGRETA